MAIKKDQIISRIERRLGLDAERNREFAAYANIVNMKWDGVPGLKGKSWAVEFIDPTGRNLLQQSINIFSTQRPKFDILPSGPASSEDAERLERWVEWQMFKVNRRGRKEPLRESLRYSTQCNMIAGQLDCMTYWNPKFEGINDGPFSVTLHEPSTVHYEMGNYGIRWVATVSNLEASEVIDHWGTYKSASADGKKVEAAVQKIEALIDENPEQRLGYVDYVDKEKRWAFCFPVPSDQEIDEIPDRGRIDIVNGKNALPFIPWSIVEGTGDALLSPLHKGKLWVNVNRTETIKRSNAYRRAFFPLFAKEGVDGEVVMDYSGDVDIATVPVGTKLTQLVPPPLDPAFDQLSLQDRNLMAESTGLQELASVQAANVQYATINALIELKVNQLAPYKVSFEKFWSQIAELMFRWVDATDKPITGYRLENNSGQLVAGEKVNVGKDDYDPETLTITCELLANNPTDRGQRINQAVQIKQAGIKMPDDELLEGLGNIAPKVSIERWYKQQIQDMALAMMQKEKDMAMQLQMSQAQAGIQMQMQAQQNPPPTQGAPAQPANQVQGGQGVNPAMGGVPPAMNAPEQTQTSLRMEGQ